MIISFITDEALGGLLKVVSDELSNFEDNIEDFTDVSLTGCLNCCGSSTTLAYDTTEVLDAENSQFYIAEGALYVKPIFFGLSEFVDGIYKLDIKFVAANSGGYTLISNCAFIDILYKCKVASLLQNIISENKAPENTEKVSTIVHLLHYALFNGSNCGCNCEELCSVFDGLTELLNNVNPLIQNDCGC